MSILSGEAASMLAPLTAPDRRADDKRRHVTLSPHTVTIARRFRGIAMQVAVPVKAYRGVCVGLKSDGSGPVAYELRLEHRDSDLSVSLAEAPDDREIWADWRSWAAFFGLPALVERGDGVAEWSPARLGAGTPAPVRRRRPRRAAFITRRHRQAPAAVTVYAKDEIIARD